MERLKRILLTLFLLVVAFGVTAEAATLRKGPYLIYPNNNTEMTVLWQADETPGTSYVEWGTTTSYGNTSGLLIESGAGTDEHQFTYIITGLTPGMLYHYSVTVDSQQVDGSFMAAPEYSETSVSFYAYGDTRTSPSTHDSVLAAVLGDVNVDPDNRQTFILHAADWNARDDEATWQGQFFNRLYSNTLEFMSKLPIMGTRGNHEGDASELKKYWPYAGSDCYYSFDYGPVHVTVIDQYAGITPGSTQYEWIVDDLASSTKPFKIALYHEPAWNADAYPPKTAGLNAQEYLQPLFVQYGVKVAVGGHNHNYARALVEGVHHITTGGGGAPLNPPVDGKPYVLIYDESYHFCRFDVSGNLLTGTAIRRNGSVIETFSVAGLGPEPIAIDDEYATLTDTELNVAAPGVLGNDYDPQGDPLTAVLDADVDNGSLALYTDGSFDYTPDAGFTGYDTFTYHVDDGGHDSPIAMVTIKVSDASALGIHEAETAFLSGPVVADSVAGYSGSGFIDYKNPSGDYAEWTVGPADPGQYSLRFRYALYSGDRPLQISVNGQVIEAGLSFPATGSWSAWGVTADVMANLDAGINMIRATATGSSGANVDYLEIRDYIPANQNPIAGFSFTTSDLTVNFTDTSTDSDGTIVSWSWDFGDGNTSIIQNPSHTYASAGIYTVSLTVADDDGATDTATLNITVNNVNTAPVFTVDPISEANATVGSAYSGSVDNATDEDGDSLAYSKVAGPTWLNVAADGALSGTPAAGDVGANSWTVQVDDGNGGSDTATLNITVDEEDVPLPGEAINPDPVKKARNISVTPTLSWTAGSDAVSHNVYLGTSSRNLVFQGNQSGTTFTPGTLNNKTRYYWRIDEVNASGKTTGTPWYFTTVR